MTTPLTLVPPHAPVLWTPAAPVTDIAAQVEPVWRDMLDLLHERKGLGLAAPQVGIGLRFFLAYLGGQCELCINPTVTAHGTKTIYAKEGCLSKPGYERWVLRPTTVTATWFDLAGQLHDMVLTRTDARVFQHEADHLDARLIFARP